jgi:hypothetical protein
MGIEKAYIHTRNKKLVGYLFLARSRHSGEAVRYSTFYYAIFVTYNITLLTYLSQVPEVYAYHSYCL